MPSVQYVHITAVYYGTDINIPILVSLILSHKSHKTSDWEAVLWDFCQRILGESDRSFSHPNYKSKNVGSISLILLKLLIFFFYIALLIFSDSE